MNLFLFHAHLDNVILQMATSELVHLISTTTMSLDSLPTAEQLTQHSRNTQAGLERRAQSEARRQEGAARVYGLLTSYTAWLEQSFLARVVEATEDGLGFLCVDTAYLPSKTRDLTPDQTHWSGLGSDGFPCDASTGGVPKVMLLTGKRAPGSTVSDPQLLPGGRTSAQLLAERLYPKGFSVATLYDRGAFRVYVVWDYEAWSDWQARNAAWRARQSSS
jgi:hypothetical protein